MRVRAPITISWIATTVLGCSVPAKQPEHSSALMDHARSASSVPSTPSTPSTPVVPADAAGPSDAARQRLADCRQRTLVKDTAVEGIHLDCGDFELSDLWVLRGRPTCPDQCVVDTVVRKAKMHGAQVAVDHLAIPGVPKASLLVHTKQDGTAWDVFAFVSSRHTVTCQRTWLEHATPEAGSEIVATCVAMLQEWVAVARPDADQCERVAAHMFALPGAPHGAGNLRDAITSSCLAGTPAIADCVLAATTSTAALECWPTLDTDPLQEP
jgi:hypothetical protein